MRLQLGNIVVYHAQREAETVQIFDVVDSAEQPGTYAADEYDAPDPKFRCHFLILNYRHSGTAPLHFAVVLDAFQRRVLYESTRKNPITIESTTLRHIRNHRETFFKRLTLGHRSITFHGGFRGVQTAFWQQTP